MPQISAPTVAEHHARQRAALLDAAREVLLADGAAAVTPARLGRETGLARSSVYTYFPSTAHVLAELVEESFHAWSAGVAARVEAAGDQPEDRVRAYVEATLDLAIAGDHRLAGALSNVDLPVQARARIADLHRSLEGPLRTAVHDLGVIEVAAAVALVQGAVESGVRVIDTRLASARRDRGDAALVEAKATTTAFVVAGLRALTGRSSPG